MIKSVLLKSNVDISQYKRLNKYLKFKSKGFASKKAKFFTADQLKQFLLRAPNNEFLLTKVSDINLD